VFGFTTSTLVALGATSDSWAGMGMRRDRLLEAFVEGSGEGPSAPCTVPEGGAIGASSQQELSRAYWGSLAIPL
jgi:hypothetical protein